MLKFTLAINLRSVAVSPVSITTFRPIVAKRLSQSCRTISANSSFGVTDLTILYLNSLVSYL